MAAPYTTGFLGMRGSGSFSADERPKNYRELILHLFPNGAAPLTAILSKMASERTDDPEFNWFEKTLASQRATGTPGQFVYIDSGLSTAYAYATHGATYGKSGGVLYVKVSDADANHFRKNHEVEFRDTDRPDNRVQSIVLDVVKAGASSYLVVQLIEDDGGSGDPTNYNLGTCDVVVVSGNAQPEGANLPDAITYDPNPRKNYTQIFVTPLSITRTAKRTRLRTEDAYARAKAEALQLHSIEMEQAFLNGALSIGTGSNGQIRRTTKGISRWIREAGVRSDFRYDSAFSGKKWISAGEYWLEEKLYQISVWNDNRELLGLCGYKVLQGINRIARTNGQFVVSTKTKAYGINVTELQLGGLVLNLIDHPLFNREPSDQDRLLIFDPRKLVYRFIDDTMFLKDPGEKIAGYTKRDATDEAFLTEAGLEVHHAQAMAELSGFSYDSLV